MTERVVLHVGAPKSGTTYLQRLLRHNQESLGRQGVLVAGRTHTELVHAGFVLREDPRLAGLPARAAGAWDRIVAEVEGFEGHTAVISYELFAGVRKRQARRAVADLGDRDVHIVVTSRDLGQTIASAWQERLKFALATPLEDWRPRPAEHGPRAEWGWRTMDPAEVATRWGAAVPADHVHVVTAPRGGARPTLLWERFAAAAGLDDVSMDLELPRVNESLGARAAEVLRRVNEQDLGPITGSREHARWLRDTLAHAVLAGLDDAPVRISDEQLAEARARAADAVERIRAAGWQVHGDLDDLAATTKDGRLPSEVPAQEVLDVAVGAIVGLLLELRAVGTGEGVGRTSGAGQQGAARASAALAGAAEAVGAVASAGGKRAELDALRAQVARLEGEVEAQRRLHERVAQLSDLVGELLLPTADLDDAALLDAVREYRSDSL